MRPLPVRPLGGLPPFVRGLSVIRGGPVPVVDTGAMLGTPSGAKPERFVTLRAGERLVALAVEEVVGVRELASLSFQDLPPLLNRVKPKVVALIGTLDANLLVVLRDARIVPDWAWRALDDCGDQAWPRG